MPGRKRKNPEEADKRRLEDSDSLKNPKKSNFKSKKLAAETSAVSTLEIEQFSADTTTSKQKGQSKVPAEMGMGKLTSVIAQEVLKAAGSSQKFLGAHVSAAGGLDNAAHNAAEIGCRSFALFLRNQRTWNSKPLDDETAKKFRAACKQHGYSGNMILPHGSYLLNAGSVDEEKLRKTRDCLVDEIKRCQTLGIDMYNFHPGSAVGDITKEDCIKKIAESINYVLERTQDVIILIETMAGQGNTIGGTFEELKSIIDLISDQQRIGVCLDTCHIFSAGKDCGIGYNIHSKKGYDDTMGQFEKVIGFEYLKAVHLNDSKGVLNSHLDRHDNIGKGKIGKVGFEFLMNDSRFNNIPMVLETPEGDYAQEMISLHKMEST